ncbi:hypothetical protein R70723_22765 [Paenibacillus sp. FSL R7-0273]|uniref:hypothetical protein n=1 Tax=Paenibacillus sp. FSL R7-0273 TaxID=1536772 RepID=UPI0004F765F4|nr:hypothetical protein [Paenibacillus sp. FSL R7-0273]AIQ48422.1 hypothetical protein R70723_22765 [Paenibacillus sp. FSL R7-0273]OMF88431.1 hypothetical protein BK144_21565 [Paenibacillus sp. FSL R7-0273]
MNKLSLSAAVLALFLVSGCGNDGSGNPSGNGAAVNTNNAGEPDAVATASIVDNEAAFRNALSKDGTWIAAALRNLNFGEELIVDGQFVHNGEPARKIALYTQDEDQDITDSFSLTAPKLIVKSENTRLEGGIFIGDVYVEADGFTVVSATVRGNIFFADKQYLSTFHLGDQGIVSGSAKVK